VGRKEGGWGQCPTKGMPAMSIRGRRDHKICTALTFQLQRSGGGPLWPVHM